MVKPKPKSSTRLIVEDFFFMLAILILAGIIFCASYVISHYIWLEGEPGR